MPKPDSLTVLNVKIASTTLKARKIETGEDTYWVPRSVIRNDDELPDTGEAQVKIETWFCEKYEIS